MSLSICQICGECLFSSSLSSDPLQHFCIGLDGPAVVESQTFLPKSLDSDSEHEQEPLYIKKKTVISAKPAALSVHNPEDLEEIGRLHMELEEMRRMMGRKVQMEKPIAVKV